MFDAKQTQISPQVTHYTIDWQGQTLRFKDWIDLCQTADSFRIAFTRLLAASPFPAFYWEVPPMTKDGLERTFEFILMNSRSLVGKKTEFHQFAEHFKPGQNVMSFDNRRGDARLIVPGPLHGDEDYGHLANFVREAPERQAAAFWKLAASEYERLLSLEPKWLSTAGLGVHWLHVRIDSRPKYYKHRAYKNLGK